MAMKLSALKNKTTANTPAPSDPGSSGSGGSGGSATSGGTPVSFENVTMTAPIINGATISNSNITDPTISGGTATGMDIDSAKITNSNFTGGTIDGSTIKSAIIENATFDGGTADGMSLASPEIQGGTFEGVAINTSSVLNSTITTSELNSCAMQGGTIESTTIGDCSMVANHHKQKTLIGNGVVTLDIFEASTWQVLAAANISVQLKNFKTGQFQAMVLIATNFGGKTVVFPTGTKFPGGTPLTFTSGGTDICVIVKDSSDMFTVYPVAYNVK